MNYAGLTGDWNPVHADAQHAAESMSGERIAHGMLVAGLISAVLGTWAAGRLRPGFERGEVWHV